jgi:dCTP deaminase
MELSIFLTTPMPPTALAVSQHLAMAAPNMSGLFVLLYGVRTRNVERHIFEGSQVRYKAKIDVVKADFQSEIAATRCARRLCVDRRRRLNAPETAIARWSQSEEPMISPSPRDASTPERRCGVLSSRRIAALIELGALSASAPFAPDQIQPASVDLRLGQKAFRVRASFLPGEDRSVETLLSQLTSDEISLDGNGAVLERGCFYVVPLLERLALPQDLSGAANPKSSTGRLDIFTRLITDRGERFDLAPCGYEGPLYAEISPRSFSIRARRGSRLTQLRFRQHDPGGLHQTSFTLSDPELAVIHGQEKLVDGPLNLRDGVVLRVDLSHPLHAGVVGYRAQKHTDVIDVDRVGAYRVEDFWDALRARADNRLILDPGDFYILASRERLRVPACLAAEMAPIDPAIGEFRVHYAGFFDPGFGATPGGEPGSRAVLEVRSREVPFILEDGQFIGRLVYEPMVEAPEALYGEAGLSNYQGQGLKLSKHFIAA